MSQSCSEELSKHKQQAIDWLVLLRSDEMDADDLCDFADWLAEDHAHSEAFAAAEVLFDQMALAAKPSQQTKGVTEYIENSSNNGCVTTNNNVIPRFVQWLLPPAVLMSISLSVVLLFFPQQMQLFNYLASDYRTSAGELRDIQLSDGSQVLLNTNSAISINYEDSSREIILHYGKARFSVAKETMRPFIVEAGQVKIQALGTVFQVYKPLQDYVQVLVQEHAVKVTNMETKHELYKHLRSDEIVVKSGQKISFKTGSTLPYPASIDLQKETAWQDQRLIINDQPLGELIEELERYRNGRIFLYDSELKNLHVTGVFSLKDPDAVLRSVCNVLNLKETRLGGWWSVVHR